MARFLVWSLLAGQGRDEATKPAPCETPADAAEIWAMVRAAEGDNDATVEDADGALWHAVVRRTGAVIRVVSVLPMSGG
jgi:hypothetical protein